MGICLRAKEPGSQSLYNTSGLLLLDAYQGLGTDTHTK